MGQTKYTTLKVSTYLKRAQNNGELEKRKQGCGGLQLDNIDFIKANNKCPSYLILAFAPALKIVKYSWTKQLKLKHYL